MDNSAVRLTAKEEAVIAERWAERTLAVYPPNTVRIFLSVKDQFRNPVGATIRANLEKLLKIVLSGESLKVADEPLDEIIRIRSVQDLSASDAVRFLPELKQVLRETVKESPSLEKLLPRCEERIDQLILRAFDTYVGCREDMFRVRANQQRAYSAKLIERAEKIIHRRLEDVVPDQNNEDQGMIHKGERP